MSSGLADDDRVAVIRWGAVAGLATCAVYPLMTFVPLPTLVTVLLASSMGPLLGVASWGLRQFLNVDRRRRTADLAALSNALAGALLSAMLLVQLAVGVRSGGKPGADAVSIWLGLDVAWDVYVGLGTLLFAASALRHPRLGYVVGGVGVLIALALLALNLYTFPTPPSEGGLVDLGPAIGLWYLVVTLRVLASSSWVRSAVAGSGRPAQA